MEQIFTIGAEIEHENRGRGVVIKTTLTSIEVIFERGGRFTYPKTSESITVVTPGEGMEENTSILTLSDIQVVLSDILDKYNGIEHRVEMGDKWLGGKLLICPKDESLQPKEVSVEMFFHKIVMLRDRLRVLEQNINSSPKLDEEDKINLQQYISRIYGSLTTFNVLFKDKADYFVGTGEKK